MSILQFLVWLFGPNSPEASPTLPIQDPQPREATSPSHEVIRAVDRRARYILAQAASLEERYSKNDGPGIRLDPDLNWIIIPKYSMPERWHPRWTSLMIMIPTAYPDVPPTGFYLTNTARLKSGKNDKHLFNGSPYKNVADLSAQGWYWYCVHAKVQEAGGWRPSNDPNASDNLFTFLNMAREALTTDD